VPSARELPCGAYGAIQFTAKPNHAASRQFMTAKPSIHKKIQAEKNDLVFDLLSQLVFCSTAHLLTTLTWS